MINDQVTREFATHQELLEFMRVLPDDVSTALLRLQEHDDQYNRRTLVRAMFAVVEGMVFVMKQECLGRPDHMRTHYDVAEIAMLREESYGVNDKGEAFLQTRYVPLLDNLKFAMAMYRRGSVAGHGLDLSGRGWQHFRAAIGVRNRVMHPKSIEELSITDRDLEAVVGGYAWFMQSIISSLTEVRDALKEEDSLAPGQYTRLQAEAQKAEAEGSALLEKLGAAPAHPADAESDSPAS
jgi:hypothetical protein